MEKLECPKCKEMKLDPVEARNALSRKDNETFICNDCGQVEAFEEMLGWKAPQN